MPACSGLVLHVGRHFWPCVLASLLTTGSPFPAQSSTSAPFFNLVDTIDFEIVPDRYPGASGQETMMDPSAKKVLADVPILFRKKRRYRQQQLLQALRVVFAIES
ncbi:uncharacterized protein BDZ83DRAFT_638744 [Colletotrichum acutatum]|uniref:Uncharacterized protein n=1 Tax=Glomerella acutata TaxID=27357 RepID=A0AAD8XC97_GLOAC|nr:uncharacterized protein BDZ83DRAFT_638744 [Colletotrichum acutatum]KAK1712230.1 hypothetical protein BDZ83DRAFT_638744 [Colletotrichum acutatum]